MGWGWSFATPPLAKRIVGAELGEPSGINSLWGNGRDEPLPERFLAVANDRRESRELPKSEGIEPGFDPGLVVVGTLSG